MMMMMMMVTIIITITITAFENKEQWQLNKMAAIPLVLSATVAIPNCITKPHSPQFIH
jgi:hypothetical protein